MDKLPNSVGMKEPVKMPEPMSVSERSTCVMVPLTYNISTVMISILELSRFCVVSKVAVIMTVSPGRYADLSAEKVTVGESPTLGSVISLNDTEGRADVAGTKTLSGVDASACVMPTTLTKSRNATVTENAYCILRSKILTLLF